MKNARLKVKMMGIPPENIIELIDATHDEIEELITLIGNRIAVLS